MKHTTRIEKEKRIVELMVRMYCRHKQHVAEMPPAYAELLAYAHRRLDKCRFGEAKKACKRCPVHCYARAQRESMRQVMRWCGPRMWLYHPLITLKHYLG